MKVVGIIAEYNPFHNGHLYQIEQARSLSHADYVIVVMSGDHVQRGMPALLDKYARARMALANGADLVLELPLYYACSSAQYFASGAVSLLHHLGVVDSLCFGSEYGQIDVLSMIAHALYQESETYSICLRNYLAAGKPYPEARMLALLDTLPKSRNNDDSDIYNILSAPNNILGIEYLKALMTCQSDIIPCTVKRLGSAYHDTQLVDSLSSAAAIRDALRQNVDLTLLKSHMPASAYQIIQEYTQEAPFLFPDDYSQLLHYKLLLDAPVGYTAYADVSEELSNRIVNYLPQYTELSEFINLLKTKDITYTRISRCLLHILLDMKQDMMQACCHDGYAHYARILGFQQASTPLLSAIKQNASIPLISKLADAKFLLSDRPIAYTLLQADLRASLIYHSGMANLSRFEQPPYNEYTHNLILL
ncbi:MAG: nucleotidyltransferase [Lachnospiraceae bacterium]